MKKLIISFFVILNFLSCEQTTRYLPVGDDEVVISGNIKGSFWREVKIRTVQDVSSQYQQFEFKPDSTEYFCFRFKKSTPSELWLSVGPNRFKVWVYPGDSVYLTAQIKSDNDDFIRQIHFEGKRANRYRYFQNKALNPLSSEIELIQFQARDQPYEDFLKLMDSAYNLELHQFDQDTNGLGLSADFVHYELNHLRYQYLRGKISEPVNRKYLRFDTTELPVGYYTFLDMVDYKDSSFQNSHLLYDFLKVAAESNIDEYIPEQVGVPRLDAFLRVLFKFSETNLTGRVKEIFETKFIDNYAKCDLDSFDSLRYLLASKGYDNKILDYYAYLSDSLRSLEFTIDKNTVVYSRAGDAINLSEQISKFPYTYLNMWFVGCRGCALDFEHQEYFVKKYGKDIQFLNICTSSPGERFDRYIDKYGETGTHYFDIDNQLSDQIFAYPYQGLFDSSANLIMNNVHRPSDSNLDEFLEKLLIKRI
ncbi:MAG: hypothetical protein RIC30_07550 [Marinoscillum sp.]|uniref:TlpA family protein disulfide reductase n=1 Tax=Marinoscillum sp. TaxID=2024838 RepID=UPI003302BC4F